MRYHIAVLVSALTASACTGQITGAPASDHSDAEVVLFEGAPLQQELRDSPVRVSQAPFVRIGAIWEADRPGAIEVSVSADGTDWSPWTPLVVQHIELEGVIGNFSGQLEFTDGMKRYFRLRGAGGVAEYARLELLATTLSESIEDGEGEGDGVSFAMRVGDANVNARSDWGARTTRCSSGLGSPYRMSIHHTETPTSDSVSPQARLRSIQNYHMNTRGWCDIGYHYLMSRDGRLWQGRAGHLMGAHTGGANSGNIGIAVMGSHGSTAITSEQTDKVAGLIRGLADDNGISIDRNAIKGHRQYKSTSCPGNVLYGQLDDIVDAAQGTSTPPPPPPPIDETVTVLGVLYVGSDTSARIEGATVTLGSQTTTTNSSGVWKFEDVPVGDYTVTASATGYQTRSITRATYASATWSSFGLSPETTTSEGTAVLQGVVYHSSDSSNRIAGAVVSLSTGQTATTDSRGFYKFTALPAGPVTITAAAAGYFTDSVDRTLVDGETEWGSVQLFAEGGSSSAGEVGGPGATCDRCDRWDFLCCNVPDNNMYFLTSFDGGESMACGGNADGRSYYATSWVRWHCGAKLQIRNPATNECVVVEVKDAGPADWVEENAGGPVIDASTQVCRDLFGSESCGWSDQLTIEAIDVPDTTPTGPAPCMW
jgi:hypothetical protein